MSLSSSHDQFGPARGNSPYSSTAETLPPLPTERVWVPRKLAKLREPDLRILHAAAHPLADVLDIQATSAKELGGRVRKFLARLLRPRSARER